MENDTIKIIAEYSRILSQILYEVLEQSYLQKIDPYQLTQKQFSILKLLKTSGPFLGSELAEILDISRPAASKNIDKLVKLKLVSRKNIMKDRRTTQIKLLKTGEDFVTAFEDMREKRQIKSLSTFNKKEQLRLSELLRRYVQQCLLQNDVMDLVCLQCNEAIKEKCILKDHIERCRFYNKIENKSQK